MAISQQQRTDLLTLVVGMFDAAPTSELLSALASGLNNGATLDQYAANLGNSSEFGALYPTYLTIEEFSARFVTNLLGGNTSDQAVADGAQFVTDLINAGFSTGQAAYEAIKAVAAAPQDDAVWGAAAAELNNKVAVADYFAVNGDYAGLSLEQMQLVTDGVTADSATVDAKKAEIDNGTILGGSSSAEGTEFFLTTATDAGSAFRGTSAADVYYADLGQNGAAGGMSNTLSSADRLDGQGGYDSLFATLVPEFYGTSGDNTVAVMPNTANIEEVMVNARDVFSNGQNNGDYVTITLDAQFMSDIDVIGSSFSNGDLIIDNLTTKQSNGADRNTIDLTVVMDHTAGSNNVTSDRSDLTVYIDEDYLLAGQTQAESTIQYEVMNMDAYDLIQAGKQNVELLDGVVFERLNFEMNGQTIELAPLLGEGSDSTGTVIRTHQDLVDAMNAAIAELGLSDQVTAVISGTFQQETATGSGEGRTAPAVQIVGAPGVELTSNENLVYLAPSQTNPTSEDGTKVQNSARYDRADEFREAEQDLPVSINIELDKVGRDADGGDLIIGAKDQTSGDTDVDQTDGVEVFYIDVRGNESRPSNLGNIASTNNALKTVYIENDEADYDGADLTVRNLLGQDGQELTLIDASAFTGDFSLAMSNTNGQQAVTSIFGSGNDSYKWSSSESDNNDDDYVNYSINMGNGDNTVIANLDGDSVDAIGESFSLTTGTGDDTVTVNMTAGVSYETMADIKANQDTYLNISTGAGDDKILVNDYGSFDVDAGAGSDFIEFDVQGSTDNSGEWTVFANTGADTFERVLYNAQLTVSFAGFEQTIDINTTAANKFVATQEFINSEIIRAIEANPELSKLLETELNAGNQQLTISSLVDGLNSLAIAIYQPELLATGTATQGQVVIASGDVTALRQGLIATESVDSDDVSDAVDIAGWTTTNNWDGSVDQTGAGNNTVYNDARVAHDTAESVGDDLADILDSGANLVNYSTGGSSNDTGLGVSFATVDAGPGSNDIIVLDSNVNSMQTVKVTGEFGKVSVVNFFDTNTDAVQADASSVGEHALDFSTFLVDKTDSSTDISGNTDSAVLANVDVILSTAGRSYTGVHGSAAAGTLLGANDVGVIRFDSSVDTSDTFSGLNATNLLAALNNTTTNQYGNLNDAALSAQATTDLVGTTQNHIIMVENDLNEGEYKVFHVTSTVTGGTVTNGDFATATYLGLMDFGASINVNVRGNSTVETAIENAIKAAQEPGNTFTVAEGAGRTDEQYNINDTLAHILAAAAGEDGSSVLANASTISITDGDLAGEQVTFTGLTSSAPGTAINFVDNTATMSVATKQSIETALSGSPEFTAADAITVTGVTELNLSDATAGLDANDTIDFADAVTLTQSEFENAFTAVGSGVNLNTTAADEITVSAVKDNGSDGVFDEIAAIDAKLSDNDTIEIADDVELAFATVTAYNEFSVTATLAVETNGSGTADAFASVALVADDNLTGDVDLVTTFNVSALADGESATIGNADAGDMIETGLSTALVDASSAIVDEDTTGILNWVFDNDTDTLTVEIADGTSTGDNETIDIVLTGVASVTASEGVFTIATLDPVA
ncbi:beta strand repeat-containing protein [Marinomonas fungiae]|uniref:beta strand repeat-containing protein n=1 Tax=Marinomonas fungiae TaxID=1137284 RepID=UPI003A8D2102